MCFEGIQVARNIKTTFIKGNLVLPGFAEVLLCLRTLIVTLAIPLVGILNRGGNQTGAPNVEECHRQKKGCGGWYVAVQCVFFLLRLESKAWNFLWCNIFLELDELVVLIPFSQLFCTEFTLENNKSNEVTHHWKRHLTTGYRLPGYAAATFITEVGGIQTPVCMCVRVCVCNAMHICMYVYVGVCLCFCVRKKAVSPWGLGGSLVFASTWHMEKCVHVWWLWRWPCMDETFLVPLDCRSLHC